MATEHTVKLTLDQLVLVRDVLTENRDLNATVLKDSSLRAERSRLGDEGRAETKRLEQRVTTLDQILGRL